MLYAISAITLSYLLGCINTGYYLVRLQTGRDIRTLASGNSGSRNVGRLLGSRGFIVTLIGDAGKGAAAVWCVQRMGGGHLLATIALLAVTAGHIWPVQLGFRGGKGFATFWGGMIFLEPLVLLAGLALCAVVYPLVRGTTKAGMMALASSPIIMAIVRFRGNPLPAMPDFALYCGLVGMVLFAHRANIRKEYCTRGSDAAPGA
ncbi:MAG TPA: glycerol-3-phosphate acyltransferase [Geobacteraceae bacterium]|nr:glycerol-3-phosphate acyltransferase [Geobacteraceae bacterium]